MTPHSTPGELARWIVRSQGLTEEHSWKRLARGYIDLEEQLEAARRFPEWCRLSEATSDVQIVRDALQVETPEYDRQEAGEAALARIEEQLEAVEREASEYSSSVMRLQEQLETLRRGAEWEEEHGGCHCRPCNELIGGSNPARIQE